MSTISSTVRHRLARWLLRGVRFPNGINSLSELLGREATAAGVSVSPETAEALPTVYACCRVIASAIASLPLQLHRRDGRGSRVAGDHPLHSVLHDQANAESTSYDLRYALACQRLLWGCAYGLIERNARGEAIALWPLESPRMRVRRDADRRLVFEYYGPSGRKQTWTHDPYRPAILRWPINSLDGVTGRSVIGMLRESLGLSAAQERFASRFFGNGTAFGGLLSSDDPLDDPDARNDLRKEIETQHAGPNKAHRLLVLGGGFKFTPFGVPPQDAQFLESRKFERSVIAGAFAVPPSMIGDLERATFSNVEHEAIRWLRDGLEPHLASFEQVIARDLIGPRASGELYARFNRAAAVRGDLKTRTESLATWRRLGVISPNEWRELEDWNPISPADGGDDYVIIGGGAATPAGEAAPPSGADGEKG